MLGINSAFKELKDLGDLIYTCEEFKSKKRNCIT